MVVVFYFGEAPGVLAGAEAFVVGFEDMGGGVGNMVVTDGDHRCNPTAICRQPIQ